MNQVPTKIVLKSTTRMSLNDRFSNIAPSTQTIRANVTAEHQVSAANRRLAQQLANRPGIPQTQTVALYNQQPGRMRRGSLQQRLGQGNVKARLTLPGPQSQPRGRGGRGGNMMMMMMQQGQGQQRDNFQWSPNRARGGRGGPALRSPRGQTNNRVGRGGSGFSGRGQFNRNWTENGLQGERGRDASFRGAPFRGARRDGKTRGFQTERMTGQSATNFRGRVGGRGQIRGGRGFRGGFRGGRGGRGSGKPQTSAAELDNQLDAYMSKAKSTLNSELDSYMSGV